MSDEKEVIYPLRLRRDVYEQLQRQARSEDLNAAQLMRRAIRRELKAIERREQADAD
jgi:hypothetical protein